MALYPNAIWRGPIPNMNPGGMLHPAQGLVVHIEEGTESGTDSWFHNPAAQASAHFGIAKDGTVHQWVDTDDESWAEVAGNSTWYSVEHEGHSGDQLTTQQLESLAKLFVWLSKLDGFAMQVAVDPTGQGLGHHSMGGAAWGGHLSCPGDPIINQKAGVVNRARQIAYPVPNPNPTGGIIVNGANRDQGGYTLVGPDGGVFAYNGAPFLGSLPGLNVHVNNIMSMAWTSTGNGYWLMGSDGGVFAFGDAAFHGSYPGLPANQRQGPRTFAVIARTDRGYDLISTTNEHYSFPV